MTQFVFTDPLPSRNPQLLDQVRDIVLVPLADAFIDVQDALAEALFRLAADAGAAQNDFMEAIQALRQQREPITARFRGHLAKAWQGLESARPLSAERTLARGAAGLTLLPEQDLEVRLAVRNLAGALQHQWRPELMRLDRYLGFIAGGLRIDGDSNPFGPEHLGVALYEAFQGVTLAAKVHLAVIKVCEHQLMPRVGQRYAELEQALAQVARLRELPQARLRRGGIPRQGQAGGQDSADTPDWIARFFADWSGGQGALVGVEVIDVHLRSGREVLPAALHQRLQQARHLRETEVGLQESAAQRRLSPREVVSALSLLQTMPGAGFDSIDDGQRGLPHALRQHLMRAAASLGVDPATTCLDPCDADALDLIALLFDAILVQSQLSAAQRRLLGQLLVPIAKLAMLDGHLFVRDGHPARRLLNLLLDACDGNGGETSAEQALLAQVEAAVTTVVRDFDEHPAVFLALEAEFGASYEQYRRRVDIAERRANELQRAEERRERARGIAAQALAERLARGPLPPVVEHFLSRVWHPSVQQAALRTDGAGPDLEAAMAVGDAVLAQLTPARSDTGLDTQRAALLQAFALAGLGAREAEQAVQELLRALAPTPAAADAEPLAPTLTALSLAPSPADPVAEPLTPMLDAGAQVEFDRITADFFRALAIGTSLDFVDREGRVQAGKLSWISPISGRLMFVNRRGGRLCVSSPEELAMMVWLDRLRLHREEDAFYSAMQGVVDGLDDPVHLKP
ncbi:DUF1631 domain-containing protein [Xanthomonas vesicatoria]|uniref:DUF1631 domain-containing protein n=1 Tax=Xanthomonas vesicatoria TaxID=56460 RepID=UPI000732055E|nr:DUF1631 domain-containing protein [Xanthomonas vesicatoria]KTF32479.1 hypothetical protein LMG919_17830 [Xanthomonas vesicatoria]MCC8557087.1 DUF1631 domain-containing protein [Xanthomonas vesicatoria]MCC8602689.1 DUF1631 domain-containing protein [Xanthomonas vesicatoria]MCC8609902.1 DUF1631 domain-containing protein [Xanthomonas vesicatoria]MCC8671989.1 DUF1631 domain-containing protein [Xanthomonas vesicatoria]